MSKFKVGDKVRVLPRLEGQHNQKPCYVDNMTYDAGGVVGMEQMQSDMIDKLESSPSMVEYRHNIDNGIPITDELLEATMDAMSGKPGAYGKQNKESIMQEELIATKDTNEDLVGSITLHSNTEVSGMFVRGNLTQSGQTGVTNV